MMLTRRKFLASTAALMATTSLVPPAAATKWPLAEQLAFAKACDDLADHFLGAITAEEQRMRWLIDACANDLRSALVGAARAMGREAARAAIAGRI